MKRLIQRLVGFYFLDQTVQMQAHLLSWQELQHIRHTRDLIQQFIIGLDGDTDALRDNLVSGLSDLSDQVARLEEHR
jgi:hypothetical protein